MDLKMTSTDYLSDMIDILRPGTSFDPHAAYDRVKVKILCALPE